MNEEMDKLSEARKKATEEILEKSFDQYKLNSKIAEDTLKNTFARNKQMVTNEHIRIGKTIKKAIKENEEHSKAILEMDLKNIQFENQSRIDNKKREVLNAENLEEINKSIRDQKLDNKKSFILNIFIAIIAAMTLIATTYGIILMKSDKLHNSIIQKKDTANDTNQIKTTNISNDNPNK